MWVEANLAHRSNNFVYPRVCVCGWWCNTASEQECLNKHTNVLIICRGWCWRLVCWPSGPGWVDSDSREAARRGDSEAAAVRGAPTGNHSHAVFFFYFPSVHFRRFLIKPTITVTSNFQAQKTIAEFQAQLDLLKVSAESPSAETEDITQLKVCEDKLHCD